MNWTEVRLSNSTEIEKKLLRGKSDFSETQTLCDVLIMNRLVLIMFKILQINADIDKFNEY